LKIVSYCETQGEGRFACAQEGCKECLAALLRENENLIWAVVFTQWIGQAALVDLVQVGRIGLWKAIQHYDPQRGVRFPTFACLAIRRRIWREVARASKATGRLEAPPHQDWVGELSSEWQRTQLHQALEEGLAQLSARQRQVIEWHYGWGGGAPQKFSEIGRTLGLCRERIRQIHNAALMLLRTPGLSLSLRSLCEQGSRENYREALRQNRVWQRKFRNRG
jgi:RNA polymerase sigma factor (sigma-70 family)